MTVIVDPPATAGRTDLTERNLIGDRTCVYKTKET